MTRAERKVEFEKATAQVECPKWQWLGDEAALIEKYGEENV